MLEITIPIQVGLQIGVPLLLGWLLIRRYATKGVDSLRVFLGGMLSYALAQAVLLAISQLIGLVGLPAIPSGWESAVSAVSFGLGIGILEELARFGVLRFWLRDVRSWAQGLMLGVGHGGAESVFSGAIGFIWFTSMSTLRAGPPPGQEMTEAEKASLDEFLAAFWNTPWQTPLFAGAQQVLMIVLSLGLATLVMRVFLTGKPIYLLAAIGLHSLAATSLVFLGNYGLIYSAAAAAVFAVIGLLIVRHFAPSPAAAPPDTASATSGASASARSSRATKARKKRTRKT